VVDPDTDAVVGRGRDLVASTGEIQRPAPACAEAVAVDDTGHGRAVAPVKVDAGIVTHDNRTAAQVCVVEVFAAPVVHGRAAGADILVGEVRLGKEHRVEEVDLDEVGAGADVALGRHRARAARRPGIEHGGAVYEHAHTVVHGHAEAVDAGLGEVEVAPPLDGEVVDVYTGSGLRARAPTVVDGGLIADDDGRAGEIGIVAIGGPPG